jgi:hypothetical protein
MSLTDKVFLRVVSAWQGAWICVCVEFLRIRKRAAEAALKKPY